MKYYRHLCLHLSLPDIFSYFRKIYALFSGLLLMSRQANMNSQTHKIHDNIAVFKNVCIYSLLLFQLGTEVPIHNAMFCICSNDAIILCKPIN